MKNKDGCASLRWSGKPVGGQIDPGEPRRPCLALALLKNAAEKLIQAMCPSPARAEKGSRLRTNSSLHPQVNSGI